MKDSYVACVDCLSNIRKSQAKSSGWSWKFWRGWLCGACTREDDVRRIQAQPAAKAKTKTRRKGKGNDS